MASRDGHAPGMNILLHGHMFKNAGSTLDWSLRQNFGADFLDHRDDEFLRDNPEGLATLVHEAPNLRAISSHWMPLPLTPDLAAEATLLFLLRHPVDRAHSVYEFERRQGEAAGPSAAHAGRLDFREFVAWRLGKSRGPVIRNYQTRYLSGDYFSRDLDSALGKAMGQLQSSCFGIVEQYDDSMILFEHTLGGSYPELDLAAPPQNVSRPVGETLAQRLLSIRSALGSVYDQLLDENQHDLQLYDWAQAQFSRRLSQVAGRDSLLAQMQSRKQQLA